MDINYLKQKLKEVLSEKRYNHSIRVMETAQELAKLYNANINNVTIAALLHDYAKEFPKKDLVNICKECCLKETNDYLEAGQILHSFAGAHFVNKYLGITDTDILNSIKYHTTGRENMELIEKIIYIADAIEPQRSYMHVDEIRKLAKENIDQAILFEINKKIEYLISNNSIIHHNTIKLRNWLITKVLNNQGG